MKLFQISRRLMNQLQKAADIVAEEVPAGTDRTKALEALADAGAHALRATSTHALEGGASECSSLACESSEAHADNGQTPAPETLAGPERETARAEMFSE